jgi:hypothetical protein
LVTILLKVIEVVETQQDKIIIHIKNQKQICIYLFV